MTNYRARQDDLVVEEFGDQLLIFDRVNNLAHRLEVDASQVWAASDGTRTPEDIASSAGLELARVRELQLDLHDRGLLRSSPGSAPISRRQVLHRAALTGGVLAGTGAISSVLVPHAAAAGSTLTSRPSPQRQNAARSPSGSLADLSNEQLAGIRVIYSYRGLTPPPALLDAVKGGRAAGVIFFADNIVSAAQIRAVTHHLQELAYDSPIGLPLLLMIEQHGGHARRLPGAPGLTHEQIGRSPRPMLAARSTARNSGLALGAVGMTVALSPVLDVSRNDINPSGREFAGSAREVGQLASSFIRSLQSTGIVAAAKYFPGLGGAGSQNVSGDPVTIDLSAGVLRSVDELPYKLAITAGLSLVMLSWATYPALDAARPAGLSPAIVDELRQRPAFDGVTMTDALGASSLSAFGSVGDRAVRAALAGVDLMLCASQNTAEGDAVVHAVAAAVGHGQLPPAAARASALRLTRLRGALHD